MRGKLLILLISSVYLYILFNRFDWSNNHVFEWDKAGYYSYLPAKFIYNDIDSLNFYPQINNKYHIASPDIDYYGVYNQPQTGKRLNKYAIGVAVAELPFFWIAHLLTLNSKTYPADGFSSYYQLSILLASIAWTIFGFICLKQLLRRYFKESITTVVILLLAFGTNLYHYTVFDGGMSHSFSFALFAVTLNFADKFYHTEKSKYLWLCSLFFGMVVITRPTNIVFFIVLLLWGINNNEDIVKRWRLCINNKITICIGILIFFAIAAIQLSYWKYITGNWVHYSYEEEGFNFLKPEIWKGLFSYRKGWFVYTPLALAGMIGFVFLKKYYPKFFWASFLFILIHVYVVFSWHQWYYGGGFGARAMVEALAVLAFPLAALLVYINNLRKKWIKQLLQTMITLLLCLNIWQTYQFSLGTIPWDHNNREYYWRVFFKSYASDDDRKLLNFEE